MTQLPEPGDAREATDPPPPPTPPPRRLALVVSWLVVVVGVILIVGFGDSSSPARQHVDNGWNGAERLSVSINARSLVFSQWMLRQAGGPGNADFSRALQDMEAMSPSPAVRLRLAILAGELHDPDEALERIAQLKFSDEQGDERAAAAALAELYNNGSQSLGAVEEASISALGWFGELALSFDQNDTSPRRAAVLREAAKSMVVAFALAVVACLALLAGLAILITGLVFYLQGRLPMRFAPPPPLVGTKVFEAAAIWFAVVILCWLAARLGGEAVGALASVAMFGLVLFVPFWPLLRGVSWRELRAALGWHTGRGVVREVGAGVLGYLAGLPIVVIALLFTAVLMKLLKSTTSHPISDQVLNGGVGTRVFIVLLAAVWAPLIEETIFRGAMYQHVRNWAGVAGGVLMTGFVFAVIHPQGMLGLPMLMVLGCNFAMIREWRGSLIAPMVGHALNNGMVTLVLLSMLG